MNVISQPSNPGINQDTAAIRPLDTNEVDAVSGGFIYIPVVVGSFMLGTGIRMGADWLVKKIF